MIVALDNFNQVKLYNINQQVFKEIHQEKNNIHSVKFSQDSKKLVIVGLEIHIYDIELDFKRKILIENEYRTTTNNINNFVYLY